MCLFTNKYETMTNTLAKRGVNKNPLESLVQPEERINSNLFSAAPYNFTQSR